LFYSAGRHCPLDEFQCNNTLCKPLAWKCDGEDDCGDNSDENPEECSECSLVNHAHVQRLCLLRSFVQICILPFCLMSSFLFGFSGKFQCPPTRAFRCQNDRVCLQVSKSCDGVNNCGDKSDELNCRKLSSLSNRCEIPSTSTMIKEIADVCVCLQRPLQLFPHVRRMSSCVATADASAPLCVVTSLTIVRIMALMRSTARQVLHVKTSTL